MSVNVGRNAKSPNDLANVSLVHLLKIVYFSFHLYCAVFGALAASLFTAWADIVIADLFQVLVKL